MLTNKYPQDKNQEQYTFKQTKFYLIKFLRLRSSSPGDSGVYSNLAIDNDQRYNSSLESMKSASGFDPDVKPLKLGENPFNGFNAPSSEA